MLKPKKGKGDLTGTSKSEKKARVMKLDRANNTASSRVAQVNAANYGDKQSVAFKERPSSGVGSKPSNAPDEVLDPSLSDQPIVKKKPAIAKYKKGTKCMKLGMK